MRPMLASQRSTRASHQISRRITPKIEYGLPMNTMCRSIGFIMVVWLTGTVVSCANSNMPLDTPLGCGDSVCAQTESCESCPEDCGACPTCGDGTCNGSETCSFCPADCGECAAKQCGNSICDEEETCESCSLDCGQCPPAPCGNGTCASDESCESCPEDCGSCPEAVVCGDAICSGDENCEERPRLQTL